MQHIKKSLVIVALLFSAQSWANSHNDVAYEFVDTMSV